jgi:hypothetical protein
MVAWLHACLASMRSRVQSPIMKRKKKIKSVIKDDVDSLKKLVNMGAVACT